MKQKMALLFLLLFVMPMTGYAADGDADGIELIINGERQAYEQGITVSTPAAGKNYIMAPADGIAAALDASCSVDQNRATLTKDGGRVVLTADSKIAFINGSRREMPVPAQMTDGTLFVPAEEVGKAFDYRVFRERAGKRVRIVSRTGLTAPAVSDETKSGMDQLYSTVHRPVPTKFEKSNARNDLIFNKEDYSDAVKKIASSDIGSIPSGTVLFTPEDFISEMTGLADWYQRAGLTTQEVRVDTQSSAGRILMNVKMLGQTIGQGNNDIELPFDRAVRVKTDYVPENANTMVIPFSKELPKPDKDDNYVLTFYARLIDGGNADYGTGRFTVQVQAPAPDWRKTVDDTVEFGAEWKRFDFLLTGYANACEIRLMAALEKQTIEIGGFLISNVGKDADVSYFNEKKSDLLAPELAPDAAWRKEAIDRIEKIRKGDFKVVVKDRFGNPIRDAAVTLDMFEHEFKFGIQMDIEYLSDAILDGYNVDNNGDEYDKFCARIGANFNALSVGNRLKWQVYDKDQRNNPGKTSTARLVIDNAKQYGLKYVRGHALWMPNTNVNDEPPELYNLMETDTRPVDERYPDLLNRIGDHFTEMDQNFPEIYEWDVTNETHGRYIYTQKFGKRIFNDVYRLAAEKLTHNQSLMLCDNRQFEDAYWERLDWFKDQGIQYDALGMQGHSATGSKDPGNNYRPQKWLEVWDRVAYEYQKTFAITEFSVGALNDEYGYEGQGDYMRDMIIAAFSHPACTGFGIWWLSDSWTDWDSPYRPDNPDNKGNGAGVSPLYNRWFGEKPGLKQYRDLLYNKWWTRDATATTDQNGVAAVNGFYGDYDVTVKVDGKTVKTVMAAFHKGYENELVITVR